MNRVARISAALCIAVLAACASTPEREINFLASAMTKLSAAVDATVRFRRPADGMAEAELLRLSVAHDPALLKPFDGMTLRVLREARDSAVLLCEPNAGKALLEDAGCTAKLDRHRWNSGADRCEFTLDVEEVCAR